MADPDRSAEVPWAHSQHLSLTAHLLRGRKREVASRESSAGEARPDPPRPRGSRRSLHVSVDSFERLPLVTKSPTRPAHRDPRLRSHGKRAWLFLGRLADVAAPAAVVARLQTQRVRGQRATQLSGESSQAFGGPG